MKNIEMKKIAANQSGFTLIEMMIVVAIIGLIASLVGLNVSKRLDEARVDTTKNQIRQLSTVLEDFRRRCGRYPDSAQGLDALVKKENAGDCKNWSDDFIQGGKLPEDAWGKPFGYLSDGNKFEIKSLGSDTREGGDGSAKDITSSDL
jgi:general secretion pathway protein G